MSVGLTSSRYDTLFDYLSSKTCRRLPYRSNQRIRASGKFVILNKYVLSGLISIDLNTLTNYGALAARLITDVGTPSTKVLRDGLDNVVNIVGIRTDDGNDLITEDGEKVYGLLQAGRDKVDGTEVNNDVQITFINENLNVVSIPEQMITFSVVTIYSQRWKHNVELFEAGSDEASTYEDNGHFWVGEDIPTMENYPATKWKSDVTKTNHINDIYYQMEGNSRIASYKFINQPTWGWQKITDKELEEIKNSTDEAISKIQNKMQVWTEQPVPPYQEGDLWLNNKELYICLYTRVNGEFNEKDWDIATKYTDDTKVNEVEYNLNETNKELEEVHTTVRVNTTTLKNTVAEVNGLKGEINLAVEEIELQQIQINQKIGRDEAEELIEETAPMILQITSSNGNIFKNGDITTTLEVTVWKQNRDITMLFDDTDFRWERVSNDPIGDEAWNALPAHNNTKTITVTEDDVSVRATFNCILES